MRHALIGTALMTMATAGSAQIMYPPTCSIEFDPVQGAEGYVLEVNSEEYDIAGETLMACSEVGIDVGFYEVRALAYNSVQRSPWSDAITVLIGSLGTPTSIRLTVPSAASE